MFRYLSSQSLIFISVVVITGSVVCIFICKLLTDFIHKNKGPLSINSPLPAISASAFVFMASLMSTQLLSDVSYARKNHFFEVYCIRNIYFYTTLLNEPQRKTFEKLLNDYVNEVVNHEWYEMQKPKPATSYKTRLILHEMMLTTYQINDSYEKNELRNSIKELNSARLERLRVASDTVPHFTWTVILALYVFVIITFLINHGEYRQWHYVVIVTVAALSSLIVIMLLSLDQPYARVEIVNPQDLIDALQKR
ncbi:MAG: DUF4239 domain-containing protein [Thermodesulfovibrionales bacterium]|nr:DUF4239 domain-containing protein [Thermodesulfovibrionales bacterium]